MLNQRNFKQMIFPKIDMTMKPQQIRFAQLPIALPSVSNARIFSLLAPLGVKSGGCGSCGK